MKNVSKLTYAHRLGRNFVYSTCQKKNPDEKKWLIFIRPCFFELSLGRDVIQKCKPDRTVYFRTQYELLANSVELRPPEASEPRVFACDPENRRQTLLVATIDDQPSPPTTGLTEEDHRLPVPFLLLHLQWQ